MGVKLVAGARVSVEGQGSAVGEDTPVASETGVREGCGSELAGATGPVAISSSGGAWAGGVANGMAGMGMAKRKEIRCGIASVRSEDGRGWLVGGASQAGGRIS